MGDEHSQGNDNVVDLIDLGEAAPELRPRDHSQTARRLAEGRRLYEAGQYDEAKMCCAEVLDADPDQAEVYELLGAIYGAEGKRELSRDMYREAERLQAEQSQHKPVPSTHTAASHPRTGGWRPLWVPEPVQLRYSVLVGAGIAAVVMLAVAPLVPGDPTIFGVNPGQLLLVLAIALVMGSGLAASGVIKTFDQELMVRSLATGSTWPLWLFLLVSGALSAWLAMLVYVLSRSVADTHSRTEALFLLTVAAIGGIVALSCPITVNFLWLGMNVIFEGALLGWAAGSIISPREWWRDEE